MFKTLLRPIFAGLLLASLSVFAPARAADAPKPDTAKAEAPKAETPATNDGDRQHIESVVHDYLLSHPEVVIEAVQAYQDHQQAEKQKAAQEQISKRSDDLLHDMQSQIVGNKQGSCTMIEFFDNQCPYCQANEPEIQKLLKDDGRIKLVLKELPILGPVSQVASKAALASVKQGKYAEFHAALLAHKGHYKDAAVVDEVAKSINLDLDKLHKDMESPEIAAEIAKNLDLAHSLEINGTPGFVIGDQIVPGASSMEELKKYVAGVCKG